MQSPIQSYRENGAIGAILDEYERAFIDLKKVISRVQDQELIAIADAETTDPDCRSIQSVLTHVVRSAFGYATYIRNHFGEEIDFPLSKTCETTAEYATALDAAFAFTEQTFVTHTDIQLESFEAEQKMRVRWGQLYDVEQIMEHAIVHILRHRRQIERFLLKLRKQP
ncbi:MAG: DinB family protein [Saprospiraceae bacterium]|nr:DinB family protein [Saprospiraceae bacterium]